MRWPDWAITLQSILSLLHNVVPVTYTRRCTVTAGGGCPRVGVLHQRAPARQQGGCQGAERLAVHRRCVCLGVALGVLPSLAEFVEAVACDLVAGLRAFA